MHIIATWFLAYVIPATASWCSVRFITQRGKAKYNIVVIHIALIISAGVSQYVIYYLGLVFPWNIDPLSIVMLVVGGLFAFVAIGAVGLWYTASAFIQEAAMLSITFLLLLSFPLYVIIPLIVPVFVVSHIISLEDWKIRSVLLSLWGIISILLFAAIQNIYLITALHAILGSFLISKSILSLGRGGGSMSNWLR